MSFASLHKIVTYIIAGLGLWALSIGPNLDVGSEVVIAITFVLSFFVEGTRIRSKRWVRGWTIAVIGLLGVQILRGALGASILTIALEFTAALQISRLFNRRGAPEHQQIAALALLMLIAATVLSTELSYGLAFAGFVVVAPWMFALVHLRTEIEASHRVDDELDDEALALVLASKQLIGPRYLLGTVALSVPLFLMTGALFIAFPRVGLGMFSFGQTSGQQMSGFGANVELGDFGVIRTDSTVVLRVMPPRMPNNPPEFLSIRMRGTSFDHYDGRRWTRSQDFLARSVGRIDSYYDIPIRLPNAQDDEWNIVLDELEEPVIFLPPQTVGLQIPPRVVGSMDVGRDITVAPGADIRYGDADGLGLRYMAYTSPDAVLQPSLDPEVARHYLQMPQGHERVAALAREWTQGADSPQEQIQALQSHLRGSGDFTYSVQMPFVGDRVPLDVFLFEARRGHCEYYSTAMAIMLRSLGVPARNATGFLGGRFNSYGGYYAISQGDAHSWVEAWVEGYGWVTVDPTPGARDGIGPDAGIFGSLQEIIDAIGTSWTADVVSYDLRAQVQLIMRLSHWLRGNDENGVAPPPEARASSESSDASPWPYLAVALSLIFVGWLVWRRRRARPDSVESLEENARRAVEILSALDAALEKLGWGRPLGRTASEHLSHLTDAGFGEVELVGRVVDRYVRVRYGGELFPPDDWERLHKAIKDIARRRELAASA